MSYLEIPEYIARFGELETIRLTDETQAGAVDGPKVETAIDDATQVVEGYIGTRYTIPLVDPPKLVKSIVAALAREALHKTRPTPEVAAAADRARSQLRDISAGRLTLPVATGEVAPEAAARLSERSNDVRPSIADQLGDFTRLGRGSYCEPSWRQ